MESIKPIKVISIHSRPKIARSESRTAEKPEDPLSADYRSYIERFKSHNKKTSYSFSLGSKIAEVQSFHKIQLRDKKAKVNKKQLIPRENSQDQEQIIENQRKKEEEDRIRVELEKKNEFIRKELLKNQSIQEWMNLNAKIFDEKRKIIEKDVAEAKRIQVEKIRNSNRLNEIRYDEIRKAREEAKKINLNIMQVDFQRDEFFRNLAERDRQEETNKPSPSTAADLIKHRLRTSKVAEEIFNCFHSDPND
jgi:hypothetical protein